MAKAWRLRQEHGSIFISFGRTGTPVHWERVAGYYRGDTVRVNKAIVNQSSEWLDRGSEGHVEATA
jgi:hypothetical protein